MQQSEIIPTIDRCFIFFTQNILVPDYPQKFKNKSLKGYTMKMYEIELQELQKAQIPFYNKDFWGLSQNESICAYIGHVYGKYKTMVNFNK